MTHIADLAVYPVKSTRGRPVPSVKVEPWGLAGDRRWMVVGPDGAALTARALPPLLQVIAEPVGPDGLKLDGPHAEPIVVDGAAASDTVPVQIWGSDLLAIRPSDTADAWLTELLGLPARLVWLDDPRRRQVNPQYGQHGDVVTFADAFPLLMATTGSLRQLNDWIAAGALERGEPAPEPLPMHRFRPNVVVEHDEPFAEDTWRRVRLGDVEFRVAKPCDRCVMTTIDPETLVKGKEPLRTLARHRRSDGRVWFAVNLIPDVPAGSTPPVVHVGDPVTVVETGRPIPETS